MHARAFHRPTRPQPKVSVPNFLPFVHRRPDPSCLTFQRSDETETVLESSVCVESSGYRRSGGIEFGRTAALRQPLQNLAVRCYDV